MVVARPPTGYEPARVGSLSPLIHLALADDAATLCHSPVRERIPTVLLDPAVELCTVCAGLAALHPPDRDPAGYLLDSDTEPGLVVVTDRAGRLVVITASPALARYRAWDHAHTTAREAARLRRGGLRGEPGDLDAWRVLLPNPAGHWRRAGVIRRRADGFHADLEDDQPEDGRRTRDRFRSQGNAVRWITRERVVHGWPDPTPGWLVLAGPRLLRRTGSHRAAVAWLRGYHTAFTGQRARAVRPVDKDTWQHDYGPGDIYVIVRASRAARLGIDPAARPHYPHDDLPYDDSPSPPPAPARTPTSHPATASAHPTWKDHHRA